MKKSIYVYLVILLHLQVINLAKGQSVGRAANYDDTLKKYRQIYASAKTVNHLINLYDAISTHYRRLNNDSALFYGRLALKIAQKNKNEFGEALSLSNIEYPLRAEGNLAEALNIQLQTLELVKQLKIPIGEVAELNSIGNTYLDMGDPATALSYYKASHGIAIRTLAKNHYWILNELSNIGNTFEKLGKPDSALYYELSIYHNKYFSYDLRPELFGRLGNAYAALGKYNEALSFYRKGVIEAVPAETPADAVLIYLQMARLFNKLNMPDSSLYYGRKAFANAKKMSLRGIILDASRLLSDLYSRKAAVDSAYHYQQLVIRYNDTLFGAKKFNEIQHILSDEQQRQQKILQEQQEIRKRYQLIVGVSVLVFVLIVAFLIWRNNLSQRKKNRLLDAQKNQLTQQRDEVQITLFQLKSTQQQLIQSEKMASLGELTAGIAHEIQNPLNFVNNFSDVNTELLDELKAALKNGNIEEALEIADNVQQNEEKINHHGKRADSIVKGMLQHSRAGSNTKEATDINKLADEYLRLAYHGLRAKDKTFNAELVTDFNEKLPLLNIVPQDIGRVMLNLFTNAFYATQQKKKMDGDKYSPVLNLTTSLSGDGKTVNIVVKDNGNGIADAIKDKIMQPFFTTKPTGEGTGLGLSLSYDIMVKGHGGTITVATKEGEFTEFIIQLPV